MPFRPGWALCMALPDWRLGGHTISDRPPPEEPSRGGKVPRSLEVGPWRRDGASRKALDLLKWVSRWWTVVFMGDARDDGPRTICAPRSSARGLVVIPHQPSQHESLSLPPLVHRLNLPLGTEQSIVVGSGPYGPSRAGPLTLGGSLHHPDTRSNRREEIRNGY